MHYEITAHGNYLRAVVGDNTRPEDFAAFFQEVQKRCAQFGLHRALVVVRPEHEVLGPDRLATFEHVGFMKGFKLALVCATWTLYQACNKAELAASRATIHVRAFLQEMEAVSWLTANS